MEQLKKVLPPIETHEFAENLVEDFLRMPFKDPKEGYSLDIRSAAFLGVCDLVKESINENPNAVNVSNKQGWTPLMYAAQGGHFEVCQLLLRHRASVDAKNAKGMSAYELAKSYSHKKVMELLDRAGTKQRKTNKK